MNDKAHRRRCQFKRHAPLMLIVLLLAFVWIIAYAAGGKITGGIAVWVVMGILVWPPMIYMLIRTLRSH